MTPAHRALCAILMLTWLAAAADAYAQPSAASPGPGSRQEAWVAAVRAHRPGEVDEALQAIAGWTQAATVAVLPPAAGTPTDPAFLGKALTLHTDIALVQRAAYDQRLPPALVGKTLLLDPKDRGAVERGYQWQVARVLAGALAADARGSATARLWYRATGALMQQQQWGDFATLRPHLEAGLDRFPDDADLLLLVGTLHLAFADVRVQRYLDASSAHVRRRLDDDNPASQALRARTQVSNRIGVEGGQNELDRSERALRLALQRDPRLLAARVRLAHVLSRRSRPQEAVDLLTLGPATLTPRLEYYAAMILGRSQAQLDRPRETLAAFERAAALLPGAQSARIALSRQALVDGHPIDGLESMLDAIGPEALTRGRAAGDPWFAYFRFHEPDAKTLLTTFRETVK
jgi:tetratricopeptide (TPR) repeat protein